MQFLISSAILFFASCNIMSRRNELNFLQVDAFTETHFGGNPAIVILQADSLDDDQMYMIAEEMKSRETVFVCESSVADFSLRFLTPKGEIDFSGHSAIAAFHALVEEGKAELVSDVTMFSLETKSGVLQVEIVKNETTRTHEVQITHQRPEFMNTYDTRVYAEALGLNLVDIMSLYPIQTVSTGTPHLVIPLMGLDALERIKPNLELIERLSADGDYDSIIAFTKDVHEVTSDAHLKHFAPALGVAEEPASGVASGCLGSYLIRHGIIDSTNRVTTIVLEQGYHLGRPSKVIVEVVGDREGIEQVKVSGTAVTVMKGVVYI